MGVAAEALATAYENKKASTIFQHLDGAYSAIGRLDEMGTAAPVLASLNSQAKVDEIRAELIQARKALGAAGGFTGARYPWRDPAHFAADMQRFHEAFARLQALIGAEVTAPEGDWAK